MLLYSLLLDAALIVTAGLLLCFLTVLYLVGSTTQMRLKRWYKHWYRKRMIARNQRVYAAFVARHSTE